MSQSLSPDVGKVLLTLEKRDARVIWMGMLGGTVGAIVKLIMVGFMLWIFLGVTLAGVLVWLGISKALSLWFFVFSFPVSVVFIWLGIRYENWRINRTYFHVCENGVRIQHLEGRAVVLPFKEIRFLSSNMRMGIVGEAFLPDQHHIDRNTLVLNLVSGKAIKLWNFSFVYTGDVIETLLTQLEKHGVSMTNK